MQTKKELILKLFAKKCSKAELELLLDMIQEDDSDTPPRVMDELFQQIGEQENVAKNTFDKVWVEVARETAGTEKRIVGKRSLRTHNHLWVRVAAAIALVLVAVFVLQYVQRDNWLMEEAMAGEIRTVELPDGSLVTLNGNSSIRYTRDWWVDTLRTVYLQGEAYFRVKNFNDGTTKFHVVTPDLTVEVLGTSFNVNAWQAKTSVFLEEGQVKVKLDQEAGRELNLEPGEVVRYSAKDKVLVPPQTIATALEVSWKQGVLEFEETPLQQILERLTTPNSLSYTIISDELSQREFTFRVPTEDLEVALEVLSRLTGTEIEKIGTELVIREK